MYIFSHQEICIVFYILQSTVFTIFYEVEIYLLIYNTVYVYITCRNDNILNIFDLLVQYSYLLYILFTKYQSTN